MADDSENSFLQPEPTESNAATADYEDELARDEEGNPVGTGLKIDEEEDNKEAEGGNEEQDTNNNEFTGQQFGLDGENDEEEENDDSNEEGENEGDEAEGEEGNEEGGGNDFTDQDRYIDPMTAGGKGEKDGKGDEKKPEEGGKKGAAEGKEGAAAAAAWERNGGSKNEKEDKDSSAVEDPIAQLMSDVDWIIKYWEKCRQNPILNMRFCPFITIATNRVLASVTGGHWYWTCFLKLQKPVTDPIQCLIDFNNGVLNAIIPAKLLLIQVCRTDPAADLIKRLRKEAEKVLNKKKKKGGKEKGGNDASAEKPPPK